MILMNIINSISISINYQDKKYNEDANVRCVALAQAGPFAVAIFYSFSQFCEINISFLSLQKQPNTAPNLFQRGVEYGKYALVMQANMI